MDLVKANVLGARISANGEDDGVELVRVGRAILVLASNLQLSRSTLSEELGTFSSIWFIISDLFNPFDTLRHTLSDHVDAMLLHIVSDLDCHLLVKASQQDASHLFKLLKLLIKVFLW